MTRRLSQHTPRFEQQNLFIYALLGIESFRRRLEGVLLQRHLGESASAVANAEPTELDYLLLGLHSVECKVRLQLAELLEDGQRLAALRRVPASRRRPTREGLLR